jgi:hypothetical protein
MISSIVPFATASRRVMTSSSGKTGHHASPFFFFLQKLILQELEIFLNLLNDLNQESQKKKNDLNKRRYVIYCAWVEVSGVSVYICT